MYNSSRKGVSPLIAAVLLIAFTMAVAAILTAWVTEFTNERTGEVSNQSQQLVQCSQGIVDILDAQYNNSGSNEANIIVTNLGSVDFNNVSVTLLGNGRVLGTAYISPLDQGSTDDTSLTSSTAPETVRVGTKNCPSITAESGFN